MPGSDSPHPQEAGAGPSAAGYEGRRPGDRRTRAIEGLHVALREMVRADDEEAICGIIVDTARRVLGLPLAGVWLSDENRVRLQPVAWDETSADLFGSVPTYTEGAGLSWRAFETGETIVVDDMAEEDDALNPATPVRSELVVPIGDHGVLNCASTEHERFDDDDVALVNLLAENAAVALDRAERERRLQRQADQLEYFNSILRHEVLNGMTVIRSRGMRIFDGTTGEVSEQATTIVRWCDEIVDVVRRVRTVLETMTGRDRVLDAVDAAAAVAETVERVGQTHSDATFELDAPSLLLVEADELLSDVVGAVIRNAVEHNDPAAVTVRVSLTARDDFARIEVADDGAGVPDAAKESVFRRNEAGHAKDIGSGFGLFFVDAMVTNYGGSVWVEDNEAGGATFVIELPLAEAPDADGTDD